MCERGNTVYLHVPVGRFDSLEWERRPIDYCIYLIVHALNGSGLLTESSCCGHGEKPGEIHLRDGRVLLVLDRPRDVDLSKLAGVNQMVLEST